MSDRGDTAQPRQIIEAVERVLCESSLATLATIIKAPAVTGAKLLIEETGARTGSLGDAALDQAATDYAPRFLASRAEAGTFSARVLAPGLAAWQEALVMFERIEPEPLLVVCGAGHVGASLVQLARLLHYRTTLIDDRADFVTRERFPDEEINLVVARGWAEAVRGAVGRGHNVSVAVVTRGHNEDEECMRAVLAARPHYVGMIGSKRRTNIVLERLRARGADEEVLKRVRAPIGLDIGAVSPEEVALSILAEIVAERRGGRGASLSAWRRAERARK